MNETAETVPASDRRCGSSGHARRGSFVDRAWRPKIKASVRSFVVVVPQVLVENTFKVASTPDQHPVQALLPNGPHPPLSEGVGVRRLDRRLDDSDAIGGEDIVEGAGELAVAVTNQEPSDARWVPEVGCTQEQRGRGSRDRDMVHGRVLPSRWRC